MRIDQHPYSLGIVAPTRSAAMVADESAWTNPAASAAMRSAAQGLEVIEAGITRNIRNVEAVRSFAFDLRTMMDMFTAASRAIAADSSKDNDLFMPLIDIAVDGVIHAQARLESKDIQSTWPLERGDILAAIMRSRSISSNVADQLDPRTQNR